MKTWAVHYELTPKQIAWEIIYWLFGILFAMFAGELYARFVDPIGVYRYYSQLPILQQAAIQDEQQAFIYRPGTMQFATWTAHIDASGNRAVPHSAPRSTCTIATISDSITFGMGVEDDQVWPDVMAQKLRTVTVINPSRPGYNARNFASVIRANPADGYIYLATSTDAKDPITYTPPSEIPPPFSALGDYFFYWVLTTQPVHAEQGVDTYVHDMGEVLTMRNLLIVSFEGNPFNAELRHVRPDTVIIPLWTYTISPVDEHPTPDGHQQIVDELMPRVWAWLPDVCPKWNMENGNE